jgi:hypothetical protein
MCLQDPEASRSSAAAYRQQGLPARDGLDAGFTAGQLLRAGYSAAEVVQSGVALDKVRAAGIRCAISAHRVVGRRDQAV